jgi:tRNA pseudouridine38-40 synthase
VQPHIGTITVQGEIQKTLKTLLQEEVELTGCGRTDGGVHAKDFFAHFDALNLDTSALMYKMNRMLPDDIAIHDIIPVHDEAHARFDAISRTYQYALHTVKLPFEHESFYFTYDSPILAKLNEAASLLLEFKDFETFCKSKSDVNTTICNVRESFWVQDGPCFKFSITSDRFLRGMIRLVVGMCLNVSRGVVSMQEVREALTSKKKLDMNWSVPPYGLMLCDIKYPYL